MAGGKNIHGYHTLTVSTSAVGASDWSAAVPDTHVVSAIITVEDNPIRFRVDGTSPAADEGHEAQDTEIITLDTEIEVRNFEAIKHSTAGGDAKLKMTTYF